MKGRNRRRRRVRNIKRERGEIKVGRVWGI